ncbi:Protein of unknown function [Gryllus bimaculatus]|nr:Protein of unknown function [Gryllus bimaculatus]
MALLVAHYCRASVRSRVAVAFKLLVAAAAYELCAVATSVAGGLKSGVCVCAGMACRALLPQDVRVDMGPLGTLRLEEQLDEKLQRVASEELREADVDIPDTIAALRTRLQEEKELVVPLDDEYMTTFLRPCHWYPDSAFQKVSAKSRSDAALG